MFRANTTVLLELLLVVGFFMAMAVGSGMTGPPCAEAGGSKPKQPQQVTPGVSPRSKSAQKPVTPKHESKPQSNKTLTSKPTIRQPTTTTKHPPPAPTKPAPDAQPSKPQKVVKPSAPATGSQFRGFFVEPLKTAPFPLTGKDADPRFFDFVDPKTGERFRTSRSLERLSEKEHYHDSSVLFQVPPQFNPNQPFSLVVFFHGNRSDVRQTVTDYRLDEQINRSGKNVILVLPQLARNAADSSPGKFSRKNAFKDFMQEAAVVLSKKLGKKHQRQFEQAPVILAAFSGGYKPLACTLDRGGIGSRIKGILLLDGLYEDLYIFGKWLLQRSKASFFINIYTEDSSCHDKTTALAQFLREHRLPFKEVWPKEVRKGQIVLLRSPHDHLQVPVAGPPREPLGELLRNLKTEPSKGHLEASAMTRTHAFSTGQTCRPP